MKPTFSTRKEFREARSLLKAAKDRVRRGYSDYLCNALSYVAGKTAGDVDFAYRVSNELQRWIGYQLTGKCWAWSHQTVEDWLRGRGYYGSTDDYRAYRVRWADHLIEQLKKQELEGKE